MPSKELIASVIEAIVKNPPKVTRFKDMETLELSEVVDYTPTAEAAIATIREALQKPTEGMLAAANEEDWDADYDITFSDCWRVMLAASALGEQSE